MKWTLSKSIGNDKALANFIAAFFLFQSLNLFVKNGLGGFAHWELLSRGILGALMAVALIPLLRFHAQSVLLPELSMAALFLFSGLYGFAEERLFPVAVNVCFAFLPLGIAAYHVKNYQILLDRLYWVSLLGQIVLAALALWPAYGARYSLPFGYAMLFWMLIALDRFCAMWKWWDLVMALVDGIFILFYGSRGPIACFFVFVAIKIFCTHGISRKRRIGVIFFALCGAFLFYCWYQDILFYLMEEGKKLGFASRTIQKILLAGTITADSGRGELLRYYLDRLDERPWVGFGLAGGWKGDGHYPHNIGIELLYSLGYPAGICLLVMCFVTLLKGITKGDTAAQRTVHIFASAAVMLLLSSSFLLSPLFFLCMGVCLHRAYDDCAT